MLGRLRKVDKVTAEAARKLTGILSFTHNFLRYEKSDLNVSKACKSAP